jgi:hypothetical protein
LAFPLSVTVRLWSGVLWRVALAGVLVSFTWQVYNLRNLPGWTERQIRREGDATRAAATSAIADTRKDLLAEVGKLRGDAMARIDSIATKTDERTGEVLEIARQTESDARDQLAGARGDLDQQLATANATLSTSANSINTLSARYVEIPDQLANVLRPSFNSLEPELTCRHLDGSGYGGCWHSRVTGLLGEAANVGGVFTKSFPEFSNSVNGIAADVHKFTSKATAPRGFWGTTKDVIVTGSGITRAASAAGLF